MEQKYPKKTTVNRKLYSKDSLAKYKNIILLMSKKRFNIIL